MFSSVSGGTWFLSKLSFDDEFAAKVFDDRVPITEVVAEWFEDKYFPQMQQVVQPDSGDDGDRMRSSVAEIISQEDGPIKQSLGAMLLAADRFDLSWQKLVEQSVLGQHIANKTLATAKLAPATRAKFAKQCMLSFNWNQLPQ